MGWLAVAIAVGALFAGCSSITRPAPAEIFAELAPAPAQVPTQLVLVAAESQAALHEGDFVLVGAGESMLPLYRQGTAVVVHPTSYFMLKRGMPVVYRNRQGTPVAHLLVERSERGWIARGINNPAADEDLVTANNLIGVVKAAFAADGSGDRLYTLAMGGGGASNANLLH